MVDYVSEVAILTEQEAREEAARTTAASMLQAAYRRDARMLEDFAKDVLETQYAQRQVIQAVHQIMLAVKNLEGDG